jgi:hypothetical protein
MRAPDLNALLLRVIDLEIRRALAPYSKLLRQLDTLRPFVGDEESHGRALDLRLLVSKRVGVSPPAGSISGALARQAAANPPVIHRLPLRGRRGRPPEAQAQARPGLEAAPEAPAQPELEIRTESVDSGPGEGARRRVIITQVRVDPETPKQ